MLIKAKDIPNSIGLAGNISVSGKIIRVFDRKAGESEKGKWSFQNAIVEDDTGEFTVCLKNRDDELKTSDVGRTISCASRETKNGILGVKVEKDEYKKDGETKSSIKVIITKSGNVTFDGTPAPEAKEEEEGIEVEPVKIDFDEVRKDTIRVTLNAWKEVLGTELTDPTNPAYKEIVGAMILAAGRNADTLFMRKVGKAKNGKD